MFKINDYIMYGTTGVCQVMDIKSEQFLMDEPQDYYVLNPIYTEHTTIMIPVESQKVSARRLHSKEDVKNFIEQILSNELFWIDDVRERNLVFRSMVNKMDCESLITLIRSIYHHKKEGSSMKKINKNDEDVMSLAKKLLNEEFSMILGSDPEEVSAYILERVAL